MIPGVNRPAITLLSWLGIKANQQSGPDSFGTTLAPIVDFMRYSKIGNRQFVTNIQANIAPNVFVDLIDSVTGVAATPAPGSVWELEAVGLASDGTNPGIINIGLRPGNNNARTHWLSSTSLSAAPSTRNPGAWIGGTQPVFAYPGDTFCFVNSNSVAQVGNSYGTIFFTELRSS